MKKKSKVDKENQKVAQDEQAQEESKKEDRDRLAEAYEEKMKRKH